MPTVNEAASNGVLDRFPTRIVDVIDFHDCAQVTLDATEILSEKYQDFMRNWGECPVSLYRLFWCLQLISIQVLYESTLSGSRSEDIWWSKF